MRVGSLFAGIGGFDLAAERAGMTVVWQSEVDKHASRVLDHHWPHVKNLGDIHGIEDAPVVDVLTGGFPCQSYSVAGSRGGLADDRGALWWEYHRLIAGLRPAWVVGENVPGLLSSRGGADFETILGSLTECGYGVAWAVLDAQYFGVAQRRRRVFIVGHSGGVPRPEILALGEGVFGDSPPSREKGEGVASTLASRTRGGGGLGTDFDLDGGLIAFPWQASWTESHQEDGTTPTLPANQSLAVAFSAGNHESSYGIGLSVEHTPPLRAGASGTNQVPTIAFSSKDHGADAAEDVAPTLRAMAHRDSHVNGGGQVAVAFAQNQRDEVRDLGDVAGALNAEPEMKQQTYVCVTPDGYNGSHADAQETRSAQVLRELRNTLGAEAYEQWAVGVIAALRTAQVLRPWLYGGGLQWADAWRRFMGDHSLSREEACTAWALLTLRETEGIRRPPSGPRPHEQLARELGAYLSLLSHHGASRRQALHDLWRSSQGLGLLREALSALQEMGRPAGDKAEPTQPTHSVRRLTPLEAERLQGFPDGWTAIPGNSDTQRYRQLGNAVAVPVVEWIMRRIVEAS